MGSMGVQNFNNSSVPEIWGKKCFTFDVNLSHESFFLVIHVVTAVINGVFAFASTFGNSLILYVIWKHSSLHTPSNTLLCCLTLSDLLVGALTQPAFVIHKIGELTSSFSLYCGTRVTTELVGITTSGVSILTLGAISVERYLALKLNLRYKEMVLTSRVLYIVGLFWVVMGAIALVKLFVSKMQGFVDVFIFLILVCSFAVIIISYSYIFRCVMRHQKNINLAEQVTKQTLNSEEIKNQRTSQMFSFLRYKKLTITMTYVLGFYLLFYLPFIVTLVARKFLGYTNVIKALYICTSSLVFLNSTVNPIVYCWRISDIRNHVKQTLKKLRCARNHTVREFENPSITVAAPSLYLNFDILGIYRRGLTKTIKVQ